MAKGLGAILVELKIAQQKARLEKGKTIICPICGVEMELDACWFCLGDEANMPDDLYKAAYEAGYAPYAYYPQNGAIDILAAIVVDGQIVARLEPARNKGQFGGWAIRTYGAADEVEVPRLIQKYGWTWQDWVPDRFIERDQK